VAIFAQSGKAIQLYPKNELNAVYISGLKCMSVEISSSFNNEFIWQNQENNSTD